MVAAQSATRPAGWGTRQVVRWTGSNGTCPPRIARLGCRTIPRRCCPRRPAHIS